MPEASPAAGHYRDTIQPFLAVSGQPDEALSDAAVMSLKHLAEAEISSSFQCDSYSFRLF